MPDTRAAPRPGSWDSSQALPVRPAQAVCQSCGEVIALSLGGGNPTWYHTNGFRDCHHAR
jgi:hypothetical protein